MEADLNATPSQIQFTLSFFLFGLGIGQLIYGPLSDRYGRKPLLLLGIIIYITASFLCAVATSINYFLLARILQAFGISAGVVLARAIVRDYFSGNELARIFSFISLITLFAPLIAPVIGGYLVTLSGWRSVFILLTCSGLVCLIATIYGYKESHPYELRQQPGILNTFATYIKVLMHKQAMAYVLSGAFGIGVMFAYLTGIPYVYIELFHIEPHYFGYLIGLNGLFLLVGAYVNSRLVVKFGIDGVLKFGLWLRLSGILLLFMGVYLEINRIEAIIFPLLICVFPGNMIVSNTAAGALNYFPAIAGTASAVIGAVSFIIGALAGIQVSVLHDGSAMPMAITMLMFAVLSMVMYLLKPS